MGASLRRAFTVTRDPAKNQFVLQVDRPRPKRE